MNQSIFRWLRVAFFASVCVVLLAGLAQAEIKFTPEERDGKVDTLNVETAFYQLRFSLAETGSATSMIYKPTQTELRAENYYALCNNMFRDWVRLAEPDPITGLTRSYGAEAGRAQVPATYKVLKQTAQELVIQFERPAVVTTDEGMPDWFPKIIIRRQITLRDDSPLVAVHLEVLNTDVKAHPVLLDVFNGLAFDRVETVVHLPALEGKLSGIDPATERSSRELFAPEIHGAWMGGVSEKGLGGAFSFRWPEVDAMTASMWKTVGTSYIACMRRVDVPAGQAITYDYNFLPFTGFKALDGMVGDLAGGIVVGSKTSHNAEVTQSEVLPGATLPVTIYLAGGSKREVTLDIRCVRQEDKSTVMQESKTATLTPGQTTTVETVLKLPVQDGLCVLSVTVSSGTDEPLMMEKPLTVGRSRLSLVPTLPAGAKRGMRDAGETLGPSMMNEAFTTIDPSFVTPHWPLVKPDAGGAVKAFFITPADGTMGHIREITQRVEMDYDYKGLGRINQPPGDLNFRDVLALRKKLRGSDPSVTVVLGVDWAVGLKREASRDILDRVREGMGLVIQDKNLDKQSELKAVILDEATELKDVIAPDVAVKVPPIRYFQLGKGRVAWVMAGFNTIRDGGDPALGNWAAIAAGPTSIDIGDIRWRGFEYAYVWLGQAIRWAGNKDSAIVMQGATIENGAVQIPVINRGPATSAKLSVVVRSPRWQEVVQVETPVEVRAGTGTLSAKMPAVLLGGPVALELTLRNAEGQVLAFASTGAKVPEVATITISPASIYWRADQLGKVKVEVASRLPRGGLRVSVVDRFNRVLAQQEKLVQFENGQASLELDLAGLTPVTIYHEVVVDFCDVADQGQMQRAAVLAQAAKPLYLLPTKPDYADRFVVALADPPVRQARHLQGCLPTVRGLGMTMHNHAYNDQVLYSTGGTKAASVNLSPTRDGRYSTDPKLKQKLTGDVMTPPLVPSDEALAATKVRWQTAARQAYDNGAFLVMIDDERRMSGEADRSPETLAAFRTWIAGRYADIAALNAAWGSSFKNYDEVMPKTRKEVADQPNVAPWLEFRMFIGEVLGKYYMAEPAKWAAEISPDLSVGEYGIYDPSVNWPIDWAKYAKVYHDTQRYGATQGPLEGIFRSFSPQTNHGVWTGYGMQRISDGARLSAWRSLLCGGHFVWYWAMEDYGFWNYAVCGGDQRPTPGYVALAKDEWPDIQGGIDRLIIASQFSDDGIALAWSYPSWVADSNALAVAPKRIVEQLGFQDKYVNLEDLPSGALEKGGYRLLIVQEASCISTDQATAMRKFVETGGTLLVVGKAGWRDLNGAPHAKGVMLDELTGVDLSQAVTVDRVAKLTWETQTLQQQVHLTQVIVKDATVLASADLDGKSVPAWTQRTLGKGKVYWLNSTLAGHDVLKANDDVESDKADTTTPPASVARTHWMIFDRIIAGAGIQPRMRLTAPAKGPVFDGETFYYQSPSGRTLFVARAVGRLNDKPLTAALGRGPAATVYDMRTGKLLASNADHFEAMFPNGRMQVMAILDYTVKSLIAQAQATKVKPGQVVQLAAAIVTDGKPADLHAFRYQVLDPAGKPITAYQGTILAREGKATIAVPTALSDTKGKYRVEVTDAITHATTTAEFEIE